MRTVSAEFFESKVRLERINEEGVMVKCNELYVVRACSFTECEAKVTDEASGYSQGEFEVLTEKRAAYREIFFSDKDEEELFFAVKVDFIILDERSGKEKRSRVAYLVQGANIETAKKNVEEVMNGSMADYRISSLSETVIEGYIG